jgi:uncharacterized SAM-binding protein YcdF (DUF218 family)
MSMALFRFFAPLGELVGFLWLLTVMASGFLLLKRRYSGAIALAVLAFIATLFGSFDLPKRLLADMEKPYVRASLADLPECDAVVALGGGHEFSNHEVFGFGFTDAADRITTTVELVRLKKAKAMVMSGGTMTVDGNETELSLLLDRWLTAWNLKTVPTYYLRKIRNTQDEALQVQAMAKEYKWKRILLVTSANHMRRSEAVFAAKGLTIVPVGCDFQGIGKVDRDRIWSPVPELARFRHWDYYFHEQIGWWLYKAHGYFTPSAPTETPPVEKK